MIISFLLLQVPDKCKSLKSSTLPTSIWFVNESVSNEWQPRTIYMTGGVKRYTSQIPTTYHDSHFIIPDIMEVSIHIWEGQQIDIWARGVSKTQFLLLLPPLSHQPDANSGCPASNAREAAVSYKNEWPVFPSSYSSFHPASLRLIDEDQVQVWINRERKREREREKKRPRDRHTR